MQNRCFCSQILMSGITWQSDSIQLVAAKACKFPQLESIRHGAFKVTKKRRSQFQHIESQSWAHFALWLWRLTVCIDCAKSLSVQERLKNDTGEWACDLLPIGSSSLEGAVSAILGHPLAGLIPHLVDSIRPAWIIFWESKSSLNVLDDLCLRNFQQVRLAAFPSLLLWWDYTHPGLTAFKIHKSTLNSQLPVRSLRPWMIW